MRGWILVGAACATSSSGLACFVGCDRPGPSIQSVGTSPSATPVPSMVAAPSSPAPSVGQVTPSRARAKAPIDEPGRMSVDAAYIAISSALAAALIRDGALATPVVVASVRPGFSVPAEIRGAMAPEMARELAQMDALHQGMAAVSAPLQRDADTRLRAQGLSYSDVREALAIGPTGRPLHFALAGTEWAPTAPPGDAVMGGKNVGEDLGYGPARLLTPAQVAATAAGLEGLTPKLFARRLDEAAAKGLADHEFDGDEGRKMLLQMYALVRAYFAKAAARGDGMLLTMS